MKRTGSSKPGSVISRWFSTGLLIAFLVLAGCQTTPTATPDPPTSTPEPPTHVPNPWQEMPNLLAGVYRAAVSTVDGVIYLTGGVGASEDGAGGQT